MKALAVKFAIGLLACFLLSFARFAHAQETQNAESATPTTEAPPAGEQASDATKEKAKQHFLRGLEFAKTEADWDAALAEFLTSRSLYPTSVAVKNAAVSLVHLRRYPEALEMYAELLREFSQDMAADERKAVETAIAELRQKVGFIAVRISQTDAEGASLFVDGKLHSRLPLANPIMVSAGNHTLRVVKAGHEPFETELIVAREQVYELEVSLSRLPIVSSGEADVRARESTAPATPVLRKAPLNKIYASLTGGAALSPSLGGDADASCASTISAPDGQSYDGCSDRERPSGFAVLAHVGYRLPIFEFGALLGYINLSESMVRTQIAGGERWYLSKDYRDETKLSLGILGATAGASWKSVVTLTGRMAAGVGRAWVTTKNRGTYLVSMTRGNQTYEGYQSRSIPEETNSIWIPFLSPELRAGLPIARGITIDASLTGFVFFAPQTLRSGSNNLSDEGSRRTVLDDIPNAFPPDSARPGILTLPRETALGTFVVGMVGIGATVEF